MENNNNGKSVRKGAWTSEEDILLRDCINQFGEGKWHRVPLRAGLNRCRKSCRLRWLNYLRPDLKRGYFGEDEVDLVVRLHKLLGNRWSLIAGRLPGRTANDVKNFWNSHIKKSSPSSGGSSSSTNAAVARITHTNILRPRPRTISNSRPLSSIKESASASAPAPAPAPAAAVKGDGGDNNTSDLDECIRWWEDLLRMTGNQQTPFPFPDYHPPTTTDSSFLQGGVHPDDHTFSDSELEHYLFSSG